MRWPWPCSRPGRSSSRWPSSATWWRAFRGAVAAAIGVFLPVYFFVVIPFPWFDRISGNPKVKAFVGGVTSGAIAGACYVLARRAITDIPTVLIALVALAIVWRFKVPEPVLIAAGAAVGLLIFWIKA